jgi:hypothetical protein
MCDLSPVVIWLFLILNEQSTHFSKTATILRKWIPKDTQGMFCLVDAIPSRHYESRFVTWVISAQLICK